MSTIEGGEFNCHIDNYKTSNIDDWDEHCFSKGHKDVVSHTCSFGHVTIVKDHPYISKKLMHKGLWQNDVKCKECNQ